MFLLPYPESAGVIREWVAVRVGQPPTRISGDLSLGQLRRLLVTEPLAQDASDHAKVRAGIQQALYDAFLAAYPSSTGGTDPSARRVTPRPVLREPITAERLLDRCQREPDHAQAACTFVETPIIRRRTERIGRVAPSAGAIYAVSAMRISPIEVSLELAGSEVWQRYRHPRGSLLTLLEAGHLAGAVSRFLASRGVAHSIICPGDFVPGQRAGRLRLATIRIGTNQRPLPAARPTQRPDAAADLIPGSIVAGTATGTLLCFDPERRRLAELPAANNVQLLRCAGRSADAERIPANWGRGPWFPTVPWLALSSSSVATLPTAVDDARITSASVKRWSCQRFAGPPTTDDWSRLLDDADAGVLVATAASWSRRMTIRRSSVASPHLEFVLPLDSPARRARGGVDGSFAIIWLIRPWEEGTQAAGWSDLVRLGRLGQQIMMNAMNMSLASRAVHVDDERPVLAALGLARGLVHTLVVGYPSRGSH